MKEKQLKFYQPYIERYFGIKLDLSEIENFNDSVKKYYESMICSGNGTILLVDRFGNSYRFLSFAKASKFLACDSKKVKEAFEAGIEIKGFTIDKV